MTFAAMNDSLNLSADEHDRLQELYRYELLDSPYEQEYNDIVELASQICNTPISLITLLDSERQWFKANVGLDVKQTDRNVAFCDHAIRGNHMMEVPDAWNDNRFVDNPLVTGEPRIRYYAGVPLVTERGYKLGTLCVIDSVPRNLQQEQSRMLNILARQVMKLFELRLNNKALKKYSNTQNTMMGILAHDVCSPLHSIRTSFEMYNTGIFSEEEIKTVFSIVPKQLSNTIDLVKNLVEWSKLLTEQGLKPSPFNLYNTCKRCLAYISLQAGLKDTKLVNNIDPKLEIQYTEQSVEFILRNLLSNSVKFTNAGSITVSAVVDSNTLVLKVTDNGKGMSADTISKVMRRQHVTPHEGTGKEKGNGFGLFMIQEFVQGNGGNMNISSNNSGTIVEISLPV